MGKRPLRSAGILLYRLEGPLEVLIGHPGGPFWQNKHEGAWSIIKGLVEPGEDENVAALREFEEETGHALGAVHMVDLGEVRLRSGKHVVAWGVEGNFDVSLLRSNTVRMTWPHHSERVIEFPEIDVVRWCSVEEASSLLNQGQIPFLERLKEYLDHAV